MEKNKFKSFLASKAGRAAMIIMFYLIIFPIVLFGSNFLAKQLPIIPMILLIVFGFFGWKALNRITPDIFLFMPIIGWIIYFIIKGALSFIIGVFVAPFILSRKIADAVSSNL